MELKVLDNALHTKAFNSVRDLCFGDTLMWNYCNAVSKSNSLKPLVSEELEYYHVAKLYDDHHPLSSHIKYVEPVLDFLKIKALIRVRFMMYPNVGEVVHRKPHRDYNFEHKAALLYLNTCDGTTEFDDSDIIESKENRICLFNGSKLYNSTTCTDAKVKAVLAINYF